MRQQLSFVVLVVLAAGCRSLDLPDPPVLGPGTVRATLLTALPGRAELVPAVGATVRLAGTTLSATADAEGNVLLPGLMTTSGRLLFSLDSDGDGSVDRARVVTLESAHAGFGKDVNLGQLTLGRLASITGKVLRGDRQALSSGHGGVNVFLPEGPQLTFTGDDGSFRLAGVPEGDVILTTFASGYRSEATTLITRSGEALQIATIVLAPDPGGAPVGQLSGVVNGSDGTPLAAVTVRAASQGQESPASTDATGRFTFGALPTGVYALALEKSGFASLRIDGVLVQAGLNEVGPYALTPGTGGTISLDGGPVGPGDAGMTVFDGGTGDGGAGDAGMTDAGDADAGGMDAGATDAGTTDAGGMDAGDADAGDVDAGVLDADAGLPPVAIAGPNQLSLPGRPVTLDGTASTGDFPLTYAWTQLTGPAVTLSSNGTAMSHSPTFTTPAAGHVLEFSLVVKDRYGRTSAPAHTEVAVGRPPSASFTPDAGLFYGGQLLVLTSTSTDVDNLAIAQHEWTLVTGSSGTLIADGGPQALFQLPSVAYLAPDELAGVQLRVTNAVGAVSTPVQRVYTVRGASPDNWSIDAGPTVTIDVGPTPAQQTLGVVMSTIIPSPPAPAYQWLCDSGLTLLGASTASPTFIPPVVEGPSRTVLCQVQATGAAPLQPAVVSTSKSLILRDTAAPTITFSPSSPRLGPFGFLTQVSEVIQPPAGILSGNCSPAAQLVPESIGRWIINSPRTVMTEGASCGPYTLSLQDLATPPNPATNAVLFPGTAVVQTAWEGPWESTQAFDDPRPVVATLGPVPKYQQERFAAPMPFAPAFEIVATQGADLHRIVSVDPFAASSCSPTCPVISTPITFPGLSTANSPEVARAAYSGAELFVSVQDPTDGGVAPTIARRSAGGGWTRFDGATGTPFMWGTTGLRTVRASGGQLLVDTHDPQLDVFTTSDLVTSGVTDAVLVAGTEGYVAAVRGATRQLAAWVKGTTSWTQRTYAFPTNVQSLKLSTFDAAITVAAFQRSTGSPTVAIARLDTNTSERAIATGTVAGYDIAGRGGVSYAVVAENGDVRLKRLTASAYAGGSTYADVPGPPRAGFMPPYPVALDVDPTCEAAWPSMAFIEDALVITWQERCAPSTQWKVMTRVIH